LNAIFYPRTGHKVSNEREFRSTPVTSANHYGKVLLLLGELPNWRGDFRRRENGGRCLIEQRPEDVVISPVDQNDFGIASSQRPRRCQPGEPPAHNHDARRLALASLHV